MATILVLDDVETNRTFLRKLLVHHGHRVVEASNGAEGLGVARVEKPDLVIADVLMPKMDGYEFVRALRADKDDAAIPVIFYSAAYREDEIRGLASANGVAHVLPKPSDPGVIVQAVDQTLGSAVSVESDEEVSSQREHLRLLNEKLLQKIMELDRLNEERGKLLSHLVNAQAEERRRIASDIHDDSIQVMTAAGMRMQMLKRGVTDPDQRQMIDKVESTISESIDRLRRMMFRLRPPELEREGLKAAIEGFIEQEFADTAVRTVVESELETEPPYEVRAVAYQIATEALMNCLKHAKASIVSVVLAEDRGQLHVIVRDDGRGFAVKDHSTEPGHLGLVNMRERAEIMGGRTHITSAPGTGTQVGVWIPWQMDGTRTDVLKASLASSSDQAGKR